VSKPLPCFPRRRWWLMAAWISFIASAVIGSAFVGGAFAEEKPKVADMLKNEPEQGEQPPPQGPKEMGPADEFERGVPRSSVRGFIAATHDGDYERAAEYLDLRRLPRTMNPEMGAEYARQLKVVLDRSLWIDLDQLSTSSQGHAEDGLPPYRDRVGRVKVGAQDVDILLQRVPRGEGVYIWKFSNATVSRIPALYDAYGYGPAGEALSKALPEFEFLGLQLWQWVMVLGLLVIGYALGFVITWPVALLLRRKGTEISKQFAAILAGPIRLLVMVLFARAWFDAVHPSVTARAIAEGKTLLIIVVTWLAVRVVELLRLQMAARMVAKGSTQAEVLLRPAAAAVKIIVIVIALAVWLENLGFNVTTLVAGLGIGGLAVALAAQKSVENLIAAITLYASAPVRVGDFCRFADKLGSVEEIGLRSTRIRTLDRTVVHVPNAAFADLQLENFADREKVWYHPQLRLRCDTTPDQVRYILVEVRKMLYAHPKVDPDPARVRFTGIGTDALLLDVFAYVPTRDYNEYLEIAEDLNLRIMDLIAEAGTGLAVPTQSVFVEKPRATDGEAVQAAAQKVHEWRENDELYLPRFPEEKIAALRGTIEYPPKGSAK
jgi:MscS family membrane protein